MTTVDQVKEWLTTTIELLVKNPAKVEITKTSDEMGVLFTLKCDQMDNGIVIGREGQNAKALRLILNALGRNAQARISLKIDDPENPPNREPRY